MTRLSLALLLATTLPAAAAPFNFLQTQGVLPKNVVPQSYRIELTPDIKALTLRGSVDISVNVTAPTKTIVLDQAGLTVTSATLADGTAAAIATDQKAQKVTLSFVSPVAAGAQLLKLVYHGPITLTPNGLYYDDYKTAAGADRRMLVTQFEAADARRMFPCWDEPAFKAKFQLSVTMPDTLAAISNTPIMQTTKAGPGLKHVVFAQTPRMSTYLLEFTAGDLGEIRGRSGTTDLAVWAPRGREQEGDYALASAEKLLTYYNDYFGVPYPLPKLDLIAVPGNFEAGAMENWGAITFIDDALLLDPASSNAATREGIHVDVAHEMAHQWSGDLVTMAWWDDLWLNEGFATWMEYKATDHFNPSWESWVRQHEGREAAMSADATPTTHPIQVVVKSDLDADSVFDEISYQKGGQVIRMIEDWLGADVFRDGMRAYMKAHQYSNATSADLWAALGAVSGKDVAGVAAAFTEQPGVPLVHVARRCTPAGASITLSTDRFSIHDPKAKKASWLIPVRLGAPGEAPQTLMLADKPVTVALKSCDAALKANFGETGYYRTQYDKASLAPLAAGFEQFGPSDRANLLGDQFALFEAGRATLASYLDLLPHLKGETDIAVWSDTLQHLRVLDHAAPAPAVRQGFYAFARGLLRPEFDRLGWDAKPHEEFLDGLLRPELIAALGRYGDQDVVAEARRRFAAFRTNPASLAPDLREPVLNIVGHEADRATYDALLALGTAAPGTEEKLRYFNAAASAADPGLIAATVALAQSDKLPNGRVLEVLAEASRHSGNPDEVWRQVLAAQGAIRPHLTDQGQAALLPAVAFSSASAAVKRALLADPASRANPGAKHLAARAADAIDTAAELQQRVQPALAAWLR